MFREIQADSKIFKLFVLNFFIIGCNLLVSLILFGFLNGCQMSSNEEVLEIPYDTIDDHIDAIYDPLIGNYKRTSSPKYKYLAIHPAPGKDNYLIDRFSHSINVKLVKDGDILNIPLQTFTIKKMSPGGLFYTITESISGEGTIGERDSITIDIKLNGESYQYNLFKDNTPFDCLIEAYDTSIYQFLVQSQNANDVSEYIIFHYLMYDPTQRFNYIVDNRCDEVCHVDAFYSLYQQCNNQYDKKWYAFFPNK